MCYVCHIPNCNRNEGLCNVRCWITDNINSNTSFMKKRLHQKSRLQKSIISTSKLLATMASWSIGCVLHDTSFVFVECICTTVLSGVSHITICNLYVYYLFLWRPFSLQRLVLQYVLFTPFKVSRQCYNEFH